MDQLICARCRQQPRASQMTGCLCDDCEQAIDGMTQQQVDADYARHVNPAEFTVERRNE